ncbi:MAG: S1 family peptidase [Nocardioidaceae bacterium]
MSQSERSPRRARRGRAAAAGVLGLAVSAVLGYSLQGPAQAMPADDDQTAGRDARAAIVGAQQVADSLGAEASGAYLDGERMVVNVTRRSAFSEVRAAGATPRLVEHSTAALNRVQTVIDRRTDIVGTSWAVDPATNQVQVHADQGVTSTEMARLRDVAARFGDRASVDRIPGNLRTTISGGDAIWGGGGRCSLGFHVTDGSANYFLTAGHCTDIISSWFEDQGQSVHLGDTVEGVFPGSDYGLSTMEGDGGPGDVNNYDGTYTDITGAREATVGETVQRSGSTTGLHDGTVSAINASVTYPEGTVDGLIETDVCAEPGDSGGALFSGGDALGLTSGGSGNCSSGGVTYFQPVVEPLSEYGMSVY